MTLSFAIAAAFMASAPTSLQEQVQPEPSPSQREIVIQGQREEDQRKRITEMIRAFTDVDSQSQIPQFLDPVCPLVVGFEDDAARQVEDRIRQIGDAIDLGAGEEGCQANLLIVGTADRDVVLDYWEDKQKRIFWGLSPRERDELRESEEPLIAWQLRVYLDANGMPVQTDPATGIRTVELTLGASRLRRASRPVAQSAVVVVDTSALAGIDTRQMADHIAMRALAPIDPEAARELTSPTILHLLDAGPDDVVPLSLTEWDFAFLKALYETSNLRNAGAQRRAIRSLVDDAVTSAADDTGNE